MVAGAGNRTVVLRDGLQGGRKIRINAVLGAADYRGAAGSCHNMCRKMASRGWLGNTANSGSGESRG